MTGMCIMTPVGSRPENSGWQDDDAGDIPVRRLLEVLHRNQFAGVVIPDHAPQMSCAAPWHSGMAFAMGYLKAMIEEVAR